MIAFFLPQRLRKKIEQNQPIVWMINLILIFVVLSLVHFILYRFIENATWEESLWVTWATFSTVGYGDFSAGTSLGRINSIIFGTIGIALLGTLFATVFETIQHKKDKRRFGFMGNPIKNGYIVFHFPGESTLRLFLREIYAVEGGVGVCLIDEVLEQLPTSITQEFGKKIHFIRGSSLDKNTYERANIEKNKAVIVFPKDPTSSASDGITNTVVKLLFSFVDEKTRVLYILVDEKNAWMFDKRAISISQDLEIFAIVQECQDKGSAVMIEKLLLNTEGANPRSVKPEKTIGFTWQQFQLAIAQKGICINPLALIHDDAPETCPTPETKILEGDRILIAAHNGYDWSKIEKQIIQ